MQAAGRLGTMLLTDSGVGADTLLPIGLLSIGLLSIRLLPVWLLSIGLLAIGLLAVSLLPISLLSVGLLAVAPGLASRQAPSHTPLAAGTRVHLCRDLRAGS